MALDVHITIWFEEDDANATIYRIQESIKAIEQTFKEKTVSCHKIFEPWFSRINIQRSISRKRKSSSIELNLDLKALNEKYHCDLPMSRTSIRGHYPYQEKVAGIELAPLDLIWHGPSYSSHGASDFKMYGSCDLVFYNRNHFRQITSVISQDPTELSWNSDLLLRIAVSLIRELTPAHLCISFEIDGPLSCSFIYHSRWKEFIKDLYRVGRRLIQPGYDYYAVGNNDHLVSFKRDTILDYGDLREDYYLAEQKTTFLAAIHEISNTVSSESLPNDIDEIDVLDCLCCDENVLCEPLSSGYFIAHKRLPYGYIWKPYATLFNRLYNNAKLPIDGLDIP